MTVYIVVECHSEGSHPTGHSVLAVYSDSVLAEAYAKTLECEWDILIFELDSPQ